MRNASALIRSSFFNHAFRSCRLFNGHFADAYKRRDSAFAVERDANDLTSLACGKTLGE